jgi:lipopolysaccharide/colanic/teichoic acid biosynthesis glycosyltransferase
MVKSPAMSQLGTTRIEHGRLASSTARRQGAQLGWSLAGTSTLLLSYLIAVALHRAELATYQFSQTVLWCTLPYALAAHWLYRGSGLPAAERRSLLLVTTAVPFLLTPLGFALLQQPYSRGAVLLVYVLSTVWFVVGDRWQWRRRTQRLLYLDSGVPRRLQLFIGDKFLHGQLLRLEPWPSDALALRSMPPIVGVVLDRHVPASDERSQLLSKLKLDHVRLYSVEAVAETLSGRKMLPAGEEDDLWQIDGNPAYDVAKRAMDVMLVLLSSPLWVPLTALVALAVRIDSPGPVLFSQIRVGSHGRQFRIWKIRSMRQELPGTTARFAAVKDERITRLGHVIRRTRLDELPQLWNVLCGHMSLVGPRPEQERFVQEFAQRIPCYPYRHLVRPGITGWAQVQQGYAGNEEETAIKLSYDLYYVAHYSLAMDLLIFFKTAKIVLTGFGSR